MVRTILPQYFTNYLHTVNKNLSENISCQLSTFWIKIGHENDWFYSQKNPVTVNLGNTLLQLIRYPTWIIHWRNIWHWRQFIAVEIEAEEGRTVTSVQRCAESHKNVTCRHVCTRFLLNYRVNIFKLMAVENLCTLNPSSVSIRPRAYHRVNTLKMSHEIAKESTKSNLQLVCLQKRPPTSFSNHEEDMIIMILYALSAKTQPNLYRNNKTCSLTWPRGILRMKYLEYKKNNCWWIHSSIYNTDGQITSSRKNTTNLEWTKISLLFI